jgi:hypothetical protein
MEATNLLVYTNAVARQDGAFNDWYDNTHLPQIPALPLAVSAVNTEILIRKYGNSPV